MAEPLSTAALLKLAGINIGVGGLKGWLMGRSEKKERKKREKQARVQQMIESFSRGGQTRYPSAVQRPVRQPSQTLQTSMDTLDPLVQELLRRGLGLGNMGGR